MDTKQFLRSILDSLQQIDYVKPEDVPNIDLYMDQVTTFMDSQLAASKRHDDDKILTKTMINNYAKNNLLPPPEKKKYTKEHVLVLIFIYYLKSILSISDIQGILNPITEKYFGNDENYSLEDIYKEVFSLEHPETQNLMKDLAKKFNTSMNTFPDASEDEADLLHTFSFICMLSYDVYIKKTLIEKMIDQMASKNPETKPSKNNRLHASRSDYLLCFTVFNRKTAIFNGTTGCTLCRMSCCRKLKIAVLFISILYPCPEVLKKPCRIRHFHNLMNGSHD